MSNWLQDLQYAFRQLRKSPGFGVTAILPLAVAIGANAVVFAALDGLVFRSLNVPHAESLSRYAGAIHLKNHTRTTLIYAIAITVLNGLPHLHSRTTDSTQVKHSLGTASPNLTFILQVFGRAHNTSETANRPTPAAARNLPLSILAEAAPFGCHARPGFPVSLLASITTEVPRRKINYRERSAGRSRFNRYRRVLARSRRLAKAIPTCSLSLLADRIQPCWLPKGSMLRFSWPYLLETQRTNAYEGKDGRSTGYVGADGA